MTDIITSPDILRPFGSQIFLAGGITNCPDWQSKFISMVDKDIQGLVIYNPRRKSFPIQGSKDWVSESEKQIKWEFERLRDSNIIVFWFCEGSENPIVLYELGMWGNSRTTRIIIGVDPDYPRRSDVMIQTRLARPDVKIYELLEDVAKSALGWAFSGEIILSTPC